MKLKFNLGELYKFIRHLNNSNYYISLYHGKLEWRSRIIDTFKKL